MSRPAIGGRRTRAVIAPPAVPAQPDAYDPAAVDRAIEEVAAKTTELIDRAPISITVGSITVRRGAITLVAGAGVSITVVDDPQRDTATITLTSP